MRRWVLCLLFLCLVPSARAYIGDTPAQCQARYGKPYKTTNHGAYYHQAGLAIFVDFSEGKADVLTFQKQEKDAQGHTVSLSEREIEELKLAAAGPRVWVERRKSVFDVMFARRWATNQGELLAYYDVDGGRLTVATRAAMERVGIRGW